MASSRGKERLKERQAAGRYFVFGSSTPRDLSYMNKLPTKFRSYDAKVRIQREGPQLKEYMEKARSLTRNGSAEPRHWAFGSSTPRDLAHMTAISSAQRIYDAKSPKKSTTSPEITTPVHKRSSTAPQPIHRVAAPPTPPKRLDEDAASEPDFVQDREELLAEQQKNKTTTKAKKKKVEKKTNEKGTPNDKTNGKGAPNEKGTPEKSKTRNEQNKTNMDEPRFTQVHEMPAEVHSTERVPQNLHEEESATAHGNTARGLNDQIIVSELTEEKKDMEIVLDKDDEQKFDKAVEDKARDILKKVEDVAEVINADFKAFAKDIKAAVESVEQKGESVTTQVEKVLDDASDHIVKKTDELISGTSDLVTGIGSTLNDTISKTENILESAEHILDDRKGADHSDYETKETKQLIISNTSTGI